MVECIVRRGLVVFSLLAVSTSLVRCQDVAFSKDKFQATQTKPTGPGIGSPSPAPAPAPAPTPSPGNITSQLFQFGQPSAQITRKVDILFVSDTSGSLDNERAAVAAGVEQFVTALPSRSDVNVAVLLAHGSTAPRSGKLYQKAAEGFVLSSSNLTLAQIAAGLNRKLVAPATDRDSDGGEEGLFSLQRLLDPANLALARSQGFFRADAALAVVFIADEQDICAEYPVGVIPKVDPDGIEPIAKKRDCVSPLISPANTYSKLLSLQASRPLVVGGIHYLSAATQPAGGEDEIAYGYLDLIALNRGLAVEITGNIATGLAAIGNLTSQKLNLRTEFIVSVPSKSDCNSINDGTTIVKVDGVSVPYSLDKPTCTVSLALAYAGHANSVVEIQFSYRVP